MKNPQQLIDTIMGHRLEISLCQGGLETLGDLIHRRHMSADLDCLSDRDLEGIGLAVRGLANSIGVELAEIEGDVVELAKLLGVDP